MCVHVCVCVCRFTLVQTHTVEFNQVAMANSEGSEVMLNRVMTKDNIGVAVLLEVNKDTFSGGKSGRRGHASLAQVQASRLATKSGQKKKLCGHSCATRGH